MTISTMRSRCSRAWPPSARPDIARSATASSNLGVESFIDSRKPPANREPILRMRLMVLDGRRTPPATVNVICAYRFSTEQRGAVDADPVGEHHGGRFGDAD